MTQAQSTPSGTRTDLDESHFNRRTRYIEDDVDTRGAAALAAGADKASERIAALTAKEDGGDVSREKQDALEARMQDKDAVSPTKQSKGLSRQETKRKKKEAKNKKAAAKAGIDAENQDESEDESVDAFRKRLSTKDSKDAREKPDASASSSAVKDPNARCGTCNMKNKWCVCQQPKQSIKRRPSASSSSQPSMAVAGIDEDSTSTDPVGVDNDDARHNATALEDDNDVGAFRKRMSMEIDEKRSAELAGMLRQDSKERDPNARCTKCNNKNKWCMCGQSGRARSVSSRPGSISSQAQLQVSGLDGKSSSSDPVLDLGYDPGSSITEGGDEIAAAGTVFYTKPVKPKMAPTMWEQERLDKQAGSDSDANEQSTPAAGNGKAPTSILDIGSKEDAELFFQQSAKNDGEEEHETLPAYMLKKSTSRKSSDTDGSAARTTRKKRAEAQEDARDTAMDPILGHFEAKNNIKAKGEKAGSKIKGRKKQSVIDSDEDDEDVVIPKISAGAAVCDDAKTPPASPTARSSAPSKDCIGQRVYVEGYGIGKLSYFGPVEFAPGEIGDWCGVELDVPNGKNNGTIQGVSYFQTKHETAGVFVSLRSGKAQMGPAPKAKPSGNGWVESEEPTPAPKIVNRKVVVKATSQSTMNESGVSVIVAQADSDDDEYDDELVDETDPFPNLASSSVLGPLAESPAGPSMFAVKGANEMHEAANIGNYDELKRLIRIGSYRIDCEDFEGRAPLMHAVHKSRMECAELLIKHGAEINRKALDESTALHEAVYVKP